MKRFLIVFCALWVFAGAALARGPAPIGDIAVGALPGEARATLALIQAGGPFAHARDGSVFGNREKILPARARGYYREYTVPTPAPRAMRASQASTITATIITIHSGASVNNPLEQLLQDKDKSGVYLAGPDTRLIVEAAAAARLALWRVDIGHVHDKQGFTALVAKALAFPDWFGGNWDAFEDCLSDLSWHPAPGYVLLLEHGKHFGAGHKQEFVTAAEVLDGAAQYWRGQGKPFWAIISGPEGWNPGLPAFPLA